MAREGLTKAQARGLVRVCRGGGKVHLRTLRSLEALGLICKGEWDGAPWRPTLEGWEVYDNLQASDWL